MTTANDRQVGGAHYQVAKYQHWDFAADARLPYLEGVFTKYVDRHERKNGAEDIEKAIHYAEKLLECAVEGRVYPVSYAYYEEPLRRFLAERPWLTVYERLALQLVCGWTSSAMLEEAVSALKQAKLSRYGS